MTGGLRPSGVGCDVCREGWYVGRTPELITPVGTPYLLYRCAVCGTLWVETERLAKIVSLDEAQRLFPDSVLT